LVWIDSPDRHVLARLTKVYLLVEILQRGVIRCLFGNPSSDRDPSIRREQAVFMRRHIRRYWGLVASTRPDGAKAASANLLMIVLPAVFMVPPR
jgi:hypothetical protein